MASIQISKYKRPGIFIEEYDQSQLANIVPVQGITNMIIGFSKKGPVNTPVLLNTVNDSVSIFGPIDRGLERKGSFFHRTVQKMLQSSPVYALNLLATDETLDKIQFSSLSGSTGIMNADTKTESYSKFFNRSGFWKRDTKSFLDEVELDNTGEPYLKYKETLLNLTNLSDKIVTVFIFKSSVTGYNVSLVQYYGSADKVPTYLYPTDYASDYLVDVVVVAGDWSDYHTLSLDSTWSKYFDSTGLLKTKVSTFVNDRNVNLLAYYQGASLVPYFRSPSGVNIFIETLINNDTDKTGLFCAFNVDMFETDYPNGMIDLIGNNLVANPTQSTIDFLSYQETITATMSYPRVNLDKPGNTWAIIDPAYDSNYRTPGASYSEYGRGALYSEGYVYGVTATFSYASQSNIVTATVNTTGSDPYVIIDGSKVTIKDGMGATLSGSLSLTASYPLQDAGITVAKIQITGTGSVTDHLVLDYANEEGDTYTFLDYQIVGGDTTFSLLANHIQNKINSETLTNGGFSATSSGVFVTITVPDAFGASSLNFDNSDVAVSISMNFTSNVKGCSYISTLHINTSGEISLSKSTSALYNANLTNPVVPNTDIVFGYATVHAGLDYNGVTSSYSFTPNTVSCGSNGFNELIDTEDFNQLYDPTNGSLAFNFDFTSNTPVTDYRQWRNKHYYNTIVNILSSSVKYKSSYILSGSTKDTLSGTTFTKVGANGFVIGNYGNSSGTFVFYKIDDEFVPGYEQNIMTISSPIATDEVGQIGKYSSFFQDYYNGAINEGDYFVGDSSSTPYFLGFSPWAGYSDYYLIEYYDSYAGSISKTGGTSSIVSGDRDYFFTNGFVTVSNKNNFKQSIDIVVPDNYVTSVNKILASQDRYTEVKVGDFLEAYVEPSLLLNENLINGLTHSEVPKYLTRITSKKVSSFTDDSGNALVEFTCDAPIKKDSFQTMRYTKVEDYVSTYKAITLGGFRMRSASMPDGTEDRQNTILDLVASGTPLFKALTNKQAIDFRYLIDSFGLGLISQSKQQLMDICGARLDCFGFLNMPSIKTFQNSGVTYTDDGVINTAYIAEGGNPDTNPAITYSFGIGSGTTCVGYFTPYLTVSDGRPLDLPPAMFVATTFMKKHNTNITSIVPWTIAAGVTNGKINGFNNVEMDFTNTDIENLNMAQMNPIVYKRNRGFVIETENTAQTEYTSALSYIHVREVLIELERALSAMLLDFQWKFNTADIRAEIKLRADVICEQFVNKNGLYNYFNKCDSENNTSDLIDRQIGVLDTYVEPIKGMGIIVNNVTILRTGAIQSGGFQ
jgi:hypothetical protein